MLTSFNGECLLWHGQQITQENAARLAQTGQVQDQLTHQETPFPPRVAQFQMQNASSTATLAVSLTVLKATGVAQNIKNGLL